MKWIFLETADIETKLHKVLGTERAVYWHDWPRTRLALRKALNPRGNAKWYVTISRLWVARRALTAHLKLFAQRFANVGRGVELIFPQKDDRKLEAEMELGPRRDGYRLAGHAMSAEEAASFQARLAQEIAEARPKPLDPVADEAYRDYAQRIRALGAAPLFRRPAADLPIAGQLPRAAAGARPVAHLQRRHGRIRCYSTRNSVSMTPT